MIRYPIKLDGDWIIYHRLTGLSPYKTGVDILALMQEGFTLTPHAERRDEFDEPTEMFGLDPIDIVAGDDGAVFCTPFQPYVAGKGYLTKQPGVGFKLSTLLDRFDVSVRPQDFQTFYSRFISSSHTLESVYRSLGSSVELYDLAHYLGPLEDALRVIRRAEVYAAEPALDAIDTDSTEAFYALCDRPSQTDILDAAGRAVGVVYEYVEAFEVDAAVDLEQVEEELFYGIQDAHGGACEAWQRVSDRNVEVLVWGSIPLSEAVLVFDDTGFCRPSDYHPKRGCR